MTNYVLDMLSVRQPSPSITFSIFTATIVTPLNL